MSTSKTRPGRHRTGLRNRTRGGRSTYATTGKSRTADFYGVWVNGKRTAPERVARS